ncbi:MAG: hypothetical protein PHY73_05465 [Candidatus Omnitrophica bacterium]|nr:hypothetical protein [Candidatus Omnitrophota bacterium]
MKKIIIGLIFCFLVFCSESVADMYHNYIEYRYQPKLGKITISDSFVRSVEYVDYVSDNWEKLAKEDIFVHGELHAGEARTFKRSAVIGKHKIDTVLTLYPPAGNGMGGAYPTTYLQVMIDEKKKIDCNIGFFPGGKEKVSQITIHPEDDAIFVDAFDFVKGEKICDHYINMSDSEIVTNEYVKTSKY